MSRPLQIRLHCDNISCSVLEGKTFEQICYLHFVSLCCSNTQISVIIIEYLSLSLILDFESVKIIEFIAYNL